MKDLDFYLAFENEFRGSTEDIISKLSIYDDLLTDVSSRLSETKLLDIGCGRGEWLIKCTRYGFDCLGLDNNKAMIEITKKAGLNVVYGNAIETLKSFKNESFNIITSFHLIEHLTFEELIELVIECKRILKPGGILLLETPCIDNILISSSNFYLDPTHITHINPETLKFTLNFYGFNHSKYYLINSGPLYSAEHEKLTRVLNGIAQDMVMISTITKDNQISVFDNEDKWVKGLKVAPSSLGAAVEFDKAAKDSLEDQIKAMKEVISAREQQIELLMASYNRIFQSLPAKLYRKCKSLLFFVRALIIKIVKLLLKKFLRFFYLDTIIYKVLKINFSSKIKIFLKRIGINSFLNLLSSKKLLSDIDQNLNITKSDQFEKEMLKHFNSNPRTKKIFDDFKSELKSK